MRNSMNGGIWETNSGVAPSQTEREAQKETIRLLNREDLVMPNKRRNSTIVKE